MTIPWLALLVPLLEHWYIKTEALSFLYDDMDIISINNWTGNTVSLLTFCGGVNSKISDGKGIEIQRLCVFESPIDLISYLSLLNRFQMKTEPILCISLGGVCDSALKTTLANSPDIIQIVMCLDNDAAGNSACEQIAQSYGDKYTLIRCLPQHKDFNEDLVASINESEPLNNVVQELEEDDSYELHT